MPDLATAFKPAGTPTRLDELPAEIDCEHAAVVATFRTPVDHAIRAGDLLAEAKALVGHGHWLDWLEENFSASVRTAQGYMKLAKHPEDARRVAHLGIGQALRALRVGELSETDAIEVAQELRLDEEWQAFAQCAAALTEIHDRALYRATAPTFAAYVVHCWGLDPQRTKKHMELAEQYAPLPAIGDRGLATCEAIIRPRIIAFDFVARWLDRRLRPPRREMPRQLPLYTLPGTGKTYPRWARVSHSPLSWGWQSPSTDRICEAIGEALVVGVIADAVIAGAEPVERRLLERDRGRLVLEVQVRVDAAIGAALTVEPDLRLTAKPDPTLTEEADPS